jgi:peptide/nickel transport system permease protein
MRLRRAIRRMLGTLGSALLVLLLGGFLGVTLIRHAPGFGIDSSELDPRFSEQTRQEIRLSREVESNPLVFYWRYLQRLTRGELGTSHSLNRPVGELLAQRWPTTLRNVGLGLACGWLLSLALALPFGLRGGGAYDLFASGTASLLLCIPSGLVALGFLYLDGPVYLAIGLTILPKIFRFARNLLVETAAAPHVLLAEAKGLRPLRVLVFHVLPPLAAPLLSLAGVSVAMALAAAIPMEAICDSPGLGQLAWQAAMGRDLDLLVILTLAVTAITVLANSFADWMTGLAPSQAGEVR